MMNDCPVSSSFLQEDPDDDNPYISISRVPADNVSNESLLSTPQSKSSRKCSNVIRDRPVFRRVSVTSTDMIDQDIKSEKALCESSRLSSSLNSFSINDRDSSLNSDSDEFSTSNQHHRKTSFSGPLFVSVPGLAPNSPGAGSTNSTPPHFQNNPLGTNYPPDSSHSSPVSSRKQCYSPSQGMLFNANNRLSKKRSATQSPVCGLPAKSSPLISCSSSRKRSLETMYSMEEGCSHQRLNSPASKRALFSTAISMNHPYSVGTAASSSFNSPCSSTASPLMFQQHAESPTTSISSNLASDDKEKVTSPSPISSNKCQNEYQHLSSDNIV